MVAALVLAAGAVALALPAIDRALQDRLYDNRPSGVACEDLPTRDAVERVLREHEGLVRRIESVGDEVWVELSVPCPESHPDGAEVLVTFPGGSDRAAIEGILEEESFGVPTSLRNI